ncbi:uncharacterized protein HMPREF1541_11025 [Cyphellophora europaea CBS 101466]|uniref:Methyltransferase domain-containing protein n=1 Tax=Cyphellophora europaea (strain CBS 101466) TaxID=1220924 RepID=W2S7L9_CYPE1|nr:uncharacterized protein HMPREF1541_11025 [Cyphellophora europaea CBS 101466]ETN43894.1 hypothetical protein HMPREF1541_11025 [Cyphellophora europaea CBS 101466]
MAAAPDAAADVAAAQTLVPDDAPEDSDASSLATADSASLASSILAYEYENGRRYQRKDQYFLPNDEGEQERLDLMHHIFLLTLGGRLYEAPILEGGKTPKRILDLGTGTGSWATQIADEIPEAEVVGVDLSPIQSSWVPPNVKFYVDDIESPWTYGPDESFDYIHQRALSGSIKDWPALFKQAFAHTRPGGWYEAQEYPIEVTSDDGTHVKAENVNEWCKNVVAACDQQGRPIAITRSLKGWMEDAGFVDVHEAEYKVPLSPWPKDPRLKEIGRYYLVQSFEAAESFILQLYTKVLGKPMDETRSFIDKVRAEIADRNLHIYAPYRFVWGRKPEASS